MNFLEKERIKFEIEDSLSKKRPDQRDCFWQAIFEIMKIYGILKDGVIK